MEENYKNDFLDLASKFDAITSAHGKITNLANELVITKEDECCKKLISSIKSADLSNKKIKVIGNELYKSLLLFYGYESVTKICSDKVIKEDLRSLNELLVELNLLVGLKKVKEQINSLIAYQRVQKLRKEKGLKLPKRTLHMAFLGNPGTGKTTVARIIGHIYNKLGLLSTGKFLEVSRTDLIAGYQGQTALKVKKVIEDARGGVLFIDEAYSITENEHSDSYGRECLTELTKGLEDYREDLVVIVAGYKEPMINFFASNPGLKSRFNMFIEFDDYNEQELLEIVSSECLNSDYEMEEELKDCLLTFFKNELSKMENNFANGRLARNIFDDLIMSHSNRLSLLGCIDTQDLKLFKLCDFLSSKN